MKSLLSPLQNLRVGDTCLEHNLRIFAGILKKTSHNDKACLEEV